MNTTEPKTFPVPDIRFTWSDWHIVAGGENPFTGEIIEPFWYCRCTSHVPVTSTGKYANVDLRVTVEEIERNNNAQLVELIHNRAAEALCSLQEFMHGEAS